MHIPYAAYSRDTHPKHKSWPPSYNASIMANRPRPAPTETLTAMLAAAPVGVEDAAAPVPEAFTSEPEPDDEAPELEPDPAVSGILARYSSVIGVWENSLPVAVEEAAAPEVSEAVGSAAMVAQPEMQFL
jgi:hypothetical protein